MSLFSKRAAYYLAELNAIHPFREGNGRTQRELINQLAYANGLGINWKAIEPPAILKATIQSFHGQRDALEGLILKHLLKQYCQFCFSFCAFQHPPEHKASRQSGALWFFKA